jgi:peroxiredoxin
VHIQEMGAKMDITKITLLALSVLLFAGCDKVGQKSKDAEIPDIPQSANEVRPLLVGDRVPILTLKTVEGKAFDLNATIAKNPTVLFFYRGGWCMYCNAHFGQLAQIEDKIKQLGFEIIAISPDRPQKLAESINKHQIGYTLLSDSDMKAARAFGIAFKLDDELLAKYAQFGIDLKDASGHDHNMLPVPSVFVIDTKGTIKFKYVNPDYKTRLAPEVLLATLKAEKNK